MTSELYERKQMFIKKLEAALLLDSGRSGLESISYSYNKKSYSEGITVSFIGGRVVRIPATCNSNGANAKAIINAIYSDF